MASAETLLHEAQYAFQGISFGNTRENRKNSARAKSLAMKIIRKFPTSSEASGAHAILQRLGDETYSSRFEYSHDHQPQPDGPHTHSQLTTQRRVESRRRGQEQIELLDWQRLILRLFRLPSAVKLTVLFGAVFLLGILGPFLFLPLLALIIFAGPFRHLFPAKSRKDVDNVIRRINARLNQYDSKGN